jgi:hypothetical protein
VAAAASMLELSLLLTLVLVVVMLPYALQQTTFRTEMLMLFYNLKNWEQRYLH